MIYIFIAPGFEEMEALTTLDILRRAGLDARAVGVGGKTVTGAHAITVECDADDADLSLDGLEMVVLPGGRPGITNLENAQSVRSAVEYAARQGLWVCAICAAGSILGHMGLLEGKRFTCFPGAEKGIENAQYSSERLVRDGRFITAKGPGCSVIFGLELVRVLCGDERAAELEASLQ